MNRGDIYLVSLNPTEGHEQNGFRPVLIVTPEQFNAATGAPLVVPITSGGNFARKLGFAVALEGTRTTTGIIRCDQPRVLDIAARRGRKIDEVPEAVMKDVLAKLSTLIE